MNKAIKRKRYGGNEVIGDELRGHGDIRRIGHILRSEF